MRTILIIDDDVALIAKLKDQLAEAGYRALASSVLAQAERECAAEQPDMVLLEVRCEGGQGWDALGRLAATWPVIVLSGAGREEDVMRGFAAGAADYLAKPYRTGELLARIDARMPVALPAAPPAAPAPAPPPPAPAPSPVKARRRRNGVEEPEESVFMSEAEEMALLRGGGSEPSAAQQAIADGASLGDRLRAERLRRHLTLVQLENELKIRMSYLQAIEDEKLTLLPRGPVALKMLRSYAGHFGIDAGAAEATYRASYSGEPPSPVVALGGARPRRPPPRWLVILLAVALALALAVGAIALLDPAFFSRLAGA